MTTTAIHRIVEHHATQRPDEPAIVGGDTVVTYRELNQRANALARHLMARGFRRGSRAIVKMTRSPELAMVLLAVLKAGGAYTCLDRDDDFHAGWPEGVSLVVDGDGEGRHATISLEQLRAASSRPGPNLPIVTRASDIACVLPARHGAPAVLVPHETITALLSCPVPSEPRWSREPAALDLWLPLMAGATVAVTDAAAARTAAA